MAEVTIVVPSYNHARFLPDCLGSVLAQTFRDWRLLLIDDRSRDESVGIAERFAREDGRIEVLRNAANLGTYATQQRGLDESASPLVAVLNSDDVWAPTKLARQVEALARHPGSPYCYVLGGKIDEEGRCLEGEDVHADWPREEVQETLPWLLDRNRILASGVVFRREGLRFPSACRYSGDWVALLERSVVGPALCVPEPLTLWRQHERNTYVASPGQMLEEIRVREAIQRKGSAWFRPRLDPRRVRSGLASNAMHLLALRAYFYDVPGARRAGLAALRLGAGGAFKRALGTLLPAERLRERLWPRRLANETGLDPRTLGRMLRERETLALAVSGRPGEA